MTEREIPIDESEGPGGDAEAVATEDERADEADEGRGDDEERAGDDVRHEIDEVRDRLLRLQAEFDNFRKREARERAAAWARAKADLTQKLLGALDDLQRFAALEPARTTAERVIEGVTMVERKIVEALEREGLEPVGEVGEPFDPNVHEAISVLPSSAPERDGTVAGVASPGYRFGNQLLRPARVQVYEHRSEEGPGGAGA